MKKALFIFIVSLSIICAKDLTIPPSFDCQKATSQLEKEICKSNTTSGYDAVLGYIYQILLKTLPTEKVEQLKSTQREWLKLTRQEGYNEDLKIIRENTFPKKNYPGGWVKRLDLAYAQRINELLTAHKDIIENFLFQAIASYSKETEVPVAFKFAFFWFIYTHYDSSHIQDDLHTTHAFSIDHESQWKKLETGKWLIAYRGNALLAITNKDGGVYQFFLFDPISKELNQLKIEECINAEQYKEKPLDLTDCIQSYFIMFDKEDIILGSGEQGWLQHKPCPEERMLYQLSPDETKLLLKKKWLNAQAKTTNRTACKKNEELIYSKGLGM